MKRLTWMCGAVWAVAFTGALNAQNPGVHKGQTLPKPTPAAPKTQQIQGSVKAIPIDSTFVVTTQKNGEIFVHAGKARILHRSQPSNIASLRPGTVVNVPG